MGSCKGNAANRGSTHVRLCGVHPSAVGFTGPGTTAEAQDQAELALKESPDRCLGQYSGARAI